MIYNESREEAHHMAKHEMTKVEAEQIFRGGIPENPETLPRIFDGLRIPMKHRSGLTILMSKLVARGMVGVVPTDDSEKTLPKYYRPSAVSHQVRRAG